MDATTTAHPPSWSAEVPMDREQEFADAFTSLWPRLFRVAAAVAGDRSAAEDAVQAAFAKAYASWGRVGRADSVEAYLRRMVVNEVLGSRRSGWSRRERPHDTVEPRTAVAAADDRLGERDAVWAAVLALPVRQRAVVVLRYYEDLSEEQIASVLGCSRGTVKSQASAALTNLRRAGALTRGDLG